MYRAKDTKLGRDVAIKVLSEEFSQDQDRVARFEREAKLLASLNHHPYIATLHGLEDADGEQFLVMELVPGETLAERIARGPIPIEEAIPLFQQIAEGLESSHYKDVVHRDLKPANIKMDAGDKPKILDFGLAKAFSGDDAHHSTRPSHRHSPRERPSGSTWERHRTCARIRPEESPWTRERTFGRSAAVSMRP